MKQCVPTHAPMQPLGSRTVRACPICFERLSPHMVTALQPCGHEFCANCMASLAKHRAPECPECPICRKQIQSTCNIFLSNIDAMDACDSANTAEPTSPVQSMVIHGVSVKTITSEQILADLKRFKVPPPLQLPRVEPDQNTPGRFVIKLQYPVPQMKRLEDTLFSQPCWANPANYKSKQTHTFSKKQDKPRNKIHTFMSTCPSKPWGHLGSLLVQLLHANGAPILGSQMPDKFFKFHNQHLPRKEEVSLRRLVRSFPELMYFNADTGMVELVTQ